MPIPDHLVEQIRDAADIVEILSEHTRLKRSGRTFRGPCPLHGGEGPNFSVDPAKGFYKCFVCGEGGTVYTFLMKHLGMSYPDAIRWTAARVGIEVPDEREERPEEDPHRHYYEVNEFARDWFRRQLWEEEGGKGAREYLERRGVGREPAERFGLGWAPEEWRAFGDAARHHGIPDWLLLELGLVKESTKGGREPYDVFRGRVIFPIVDLAGRVVAFGGRILGQAEEHVPKYLNSPETPVYSKGRTLYGLNWSKNAIRREETALVVEGYMDYVSLASHGVGNAVAPLGTAMTEEQAALIGRYCGRAILLYDSDKAGLKATFRSGDELLRAGVEVLVATLPEGEDPDSLVRGKGAAALKRYLDDAVDVLERKIQILERKDYFGSIRGTRQAIDSLLPTVRAAADEVMRGVYIQRISEKTGVPRETLEKEAAEAPAHERRAGAPPRDRGTPPPHAPHHGGHARPEDVGAMTRAVMERHLPERILLLLMLRDEAWVERAAGDLSPGDFRHPPYGAVFAGLVEAEGRRDAEGEWLNVFPPEVLPLVEELRGDPEAATLVPADQFFNGSLQLIRARSIQARLAEIARELSVAAPEQQLMLFREKKQLTDELRGTSGYLRKAGLMKAPLVLTERPVNGPYGS
ncbi:DNA primase [Longimicrobium sp.]|uniref:DNA primase n=1 Tax=Longimicrobium sp. TaxID=2029185 RepID=UPI002C09022D|nr:DNA primase [Longimicrobium sp.]HSU15139.1 DNA primase [Longimicrobium sp.]